VTGQTEAGGVNRASGDDPEGLGWFQQVKPFGIIRADWCGPVGLAGGTDELAADPTT
jgi:hypothetical protein